tara:strand:- start:3 stop:470 length:468 start_codon:yes stop_codon:yes gene_type:complete
MQSSVTIRDLKLSDMDQVLLLAKEAHSESSYSHLDFDADVIMAMATTWIANPEVYFCRIMVSPENKIFGMYVGLISSYYFGKDLVATDMLLFVSQDRRGGIAAARLIKEFEDWGFANGAKEVRPASSTGVKTEETKQLYNALGYKTVGHTFVKRR